MPDQTSTIVSKVWGMCNDVRKLTKQFVKEKENHEIKNVDAWLKGGSGREEDGEDEEKFEVGAEVSSMVEKNGVEIGDVLKITKVGKDFVMCSNEGKPVGKFKFDEVFLVK